VQPRGEREHVVELLAIAPLPPGRVVQVLPPALGVGAGRLQVRVRGGGDAHVRPRGRDPQRGDPLQRLGIRDRRAVRVEVDEPLAATLAAQARLTAVDVQQIAGIQGHARGRR